MTNIEIPNLPIVPRVVGPVLPISLVSRLIPAVLAVAAFVVFVALSVTSHTPAPHAAAQAVTLASYGGPEYRVPAPDDGPANPVAECLLAQGYRGDDNDAVSAIYAPESAVAACAGEAVSLPDDSNIMGGEAPSSRV
jgi:hypothetical protein